MKLHKILMGMAIAIMTTGLCAMIPEEKEEETSEEVKVSLQENLPYDIHELIIIILAQADTLEEAIHSIRPLSQTSKYFNELFETKDINDLLIQHLKKFTDNNEILAAAALGTDYAKENYIKTKPKEIQKALEDAIVNGYALSVHGLLKAGANPNKGLFEGAVVPIQLAVHFNQPKILKILLDAGASLRNKRVNRLVVRQAVENGNAEIVRILMEAGANPVTKDSLGNTPLSIAQQKGFQDIVKLLQDYGATE